MKIQLAGMILMALACASATAEVRPVFGTNGSRVIRVGDQDVPPDATGYFWNNGRYQFIYSSPHQSAPTGSERSEASLSRSSQEKPPLPPLSSPFQARKDQEISAATQSRPNLTPVVSANGARTVRIAEQAVPEGATAFYWDGSKYAFTFDRPAERPTEQTAGVTPPPSTGTHGRSVVADQGTSSGVVSLRNASSEARPVDTTPKVPTTDPEREKIAARVKAIEEKWGVKVDWDVESPGFYPSHWTNPTDPTKKPANPQGKTVTDTDTILKSLDAIEKFLEPYNPQVIGKNLKHIHLAQDLGFYGKTYGGTYAGDAIYVGVFGGNANQGTMHHELSSILTENYGFDTKKWDRHLPEGYQYEAVNGITALGRSDLHGSTPELCAQGFPCRYAAVAREEDINMTADRMMSDQEGYANYVAQYPRLAGKREELMNFYKEHNILASPPQNSNGELLVLSPSPRLRQ